MAFRKQYVNLPAKGTALELGPPIIRAEHPPIVGADPPSPRVRVVVVVRCPHGCPSSLHRLLPWCLHSLAIEPEMWYDASRPASSIVPDIPVCAS